MADRTQWTPFQEAMIATLAAGGWVKVARLRDCRGREGLRCEVRAALDQLVEAGLARRSRSGCYWAAAGRPAR